MHTFGRHIPGGDCHNFRHEPIRTTHVHLGVFSGTAERAVEQRLLVLAVHSDVRVQLLRAAVPQQRQEGGVLLRAREIVQFKADSVDIHVAGHAQHGGDTDSRGDEDVVDPGRLDLQQITWFADLESVTDVQFVQCRRAAARVLLALDRNDEAVLGIRAAAQRVLPGDRRGPNDIDVGARQVLSQRSAVAAGSAERISPSASPERCRSR